ncbi:hypothetical protein [Gordonia polyisoprenivorans]|uniref:hypothetical protein n=1 Tax=Gordonia polyisoprenivorans TaxID=84595 RepID=UPI001FCA5D68|nr:hypothetical protein [Gordonia polyisoprenivorans]
MPKSARRSAQSSPVDESARAVDGDDVVTREDVDTTGAGEVSVGAGERAGSGTSEPTPLDGDGFLEANRRERERLRADAERKAARSTDPDRVPRKLGDDEPATPGPVRRRRMTIAGSRGLFAVVAVLVVLVVGLGVSTGVLAYRLHSADSAAAVGPSDADRKAVIDTAKSYAATLTTYDSSNYGDLDARIRRISTPDFAKTFIASSQDARAGNANAKGVSKATAAHGGIESMSADNAVVLVSLDQTITSPELTSEVPQGIPYQSRVLVTLTRQDGRWMLAGFTVVE